MAAIMFEWLLKLKNDNRTNEIMVRIENVVKTTIVSLYCEAAAWVEFVDY